MVERCSGERCRIGIFVPPRGPKDSPVVILGESPGKVEAENGLPFIGPSGQFLREKSMAVDFPLAGCYITNACKAFVEGNPNPKAAELRDCRERCLRAEIESYPRLLIVALGNSAAFACGVLKGTSGITGVRGKIMDSCFENPDGTRIPVLSSFHPAAILRGGGPEMGVLFERDLAFAVRYIRGDVDEGSDLLGELPSASFMSFGEEEAEKLLSDARESMWMAVDIETDGLDPRAPDAKIVGIALCASDGRAFFARQEDEQERAIGVIREALRSKVRIVGHNAKFDAMWLHLHLGLELDAYQYDTLLFYNLIAEEGVAKEGDDQIRRGLKLLAEVYLGWPEYDVGIKRLLEDRKISDLSEEELISSVRSIGPGNVITKALEEVLLASPKLAPSRTEIAKRVVELDPDMTISKVRPMINEVVETWKGHVSSLLARKRMSEIDPRLVREYACYDALATFLLARLLWSKMQEEGLDKYYEQVERKKLITFIKMMRRPHYVDIGLLQEFSVPLRAEISKITSQLRTIAEDPDFNPGSTQQVSKLLYEKLGASVIGRTESGAPSTSAEILKELEGLNRTPISSIASLLLRYRELSKLSSAYVDQLSRLAIPISGRYVVFPSINLASTVTGRLSYDKPNLQQMPSALKCLILPERGYVFVDADLRQAEPRVATMYSKDPKLIKLFRRRSCDRCKVVYDGERICPKCGSTCRPADVYMELAVEIYKNLEEAKEHRDLVKRVFLATMYGQSVRSTAEQLGIEVQKAEFAISKLRDSYPDFFWYFDNLTKVVTQPPYEVTSFYGRKRRLRSFMTSQDEMTREAGIRRAVNHPIQSASSDMVCLMIYRAEKEFEEKKVDAWASIFVHDSILFTVNARDVERALSVIRKVMTDSPYPHTMLDVDIFVGVRWGDSRHLFSYFEKE